MFVCHCRRCGRAWYNTQKTEYVARILVVDDEEAIRLVLREALEHAGYEVVEAEDGVAGIEQYHLWRVDLVILDILMPRKDGLETIKELRQVDPAVKIIAISGGVRGSNVDNLALAQALGARRTLAKPFRLHEMLEIVAAVLCETEPSSPS
jgi:CheY-like chemotaxis protein